MVLSSLDRKSAHRSPITAARSHAEFHSRIQSTVDKFFEQWYLEWGQTIGTGPRKEYLPFSFLYLQGESRIL